MGQNDTDQNLLSITLFLTVILDKLIKCVILNIILRFFSKNLKINGT
jgi:hypothetical protein